MHYGGILRGGGGSYPCPVPLTLPFVFPKVAPKSTGGDPGVLMQCCQAYTEVSQAASSSVKSVVTTAADKKLAHVEHSQGKDAAQLYGHLGWTAKNVTSGGLAAQSCMHPVKGVAKGIAKGVVKKSARVQQ